MMNQSLASKFLTRYWGNLTIAVLALVAIIGYLSGFFFYTNIFPCWPPPGLAVDGMAIAEVLTWDDLNGNGLLENGEPPLPWVTIDFVSGYPPSITGSDGKGSVGKFKPGCACNCWVSESIKVVVPYGYRATTPTQVDLTGKETAYTFGFRLQDEIQQLSFPNEPDWFRAFINRGVILTAFHYSSIDNHLAITLKSSIAQDIEGTYDDIFNIISELSYSNIAIQQISIATNTTSEVTNCEPDVVHKWSGMISYSEIVASYCQHSQP